MTARKIAVVLAGAALAIPLGSILGSTIVAPVLRAGLVALWLTAALRPDIAVLSLALLAPFGSVLLVAMDAPPVQFTEALVLATLSGSVIAAGLRRESGDRAPSPSMVPAAILFIGVVLCSLAVFLAVSQIGLGIRWHFVRSVATLLARDYLSSPPGQWVNLTAAARLIEGVLLLLVVAGLIRRRASGTLRIMGALTIASAAGAVMSLSEAAASLRAAASFQEVPATLLTSRIGAFVADANAAGSFFALAGFVALGFAAQAGAHKALRCASSVVAAALLVALLLTGSRSAVVAIVAVLAGAAIWAGWRGRLQLPRWSIAAAVVVAVLLALAVGFDPRAVARRSLVQTLEERAAFLITGVRMMQQAPLFGMGIGRYFETSGGFMPQSIYWFHLRENAHNNFLQIGGELGLAGLVAFAWLLGAAATRIVRGLLADSRDRLLAGAFAGLAAFVVTWMAGHPLLTPEVAVPFWILAGAAVARADAGRQGIAVDAPSRPAAFGGRTAVAVTAALLCLAVSVPIRARRDAGTLNLAEQSFGFYDWEGERATGRFRWTSATATFFVPARAEALDLPICAAWSDKRPGTTVVTIRVDGQVLQKLGLTTGNWMVVQLRLPPATGHDPFRRLDITTEPPWSPAAVLGTHDSRVLGVQVGEVTVK